MTFEGDYRQGRHVVSALHGDTMLSCCQAAMRKACAAFDAELRQFTGEQPATSACSPGTRRKPLVNSPKGIPARRLRAGFTSRVNYPSRHGHFWPKFPGQRLRSR
jgi:hypothetical protein